MTCCSVTAPSAAGGPATFGRRPRRPSRTLRFTEDRGLRWIDSPGQRSRRAAGVLRRVRVVAVLARARQGADQHRAGLPRRADRHSDDGADLGRRARATTTTSTSASRATSARRSRFAAMASYLHTCYRIGDIDRSVSFYEKLGFEERRRMDIGTRRSTSSWACPDEDPVLELTYNHGVDSYDLGTGYNHIAIAVDDLDGTLEGLAERGHRAGEAALPPRRPHRGPVHRLRARSGRLPDRAHRARRLAAKAGASLDGMARRTDIFNVGKLGLSSGEGRRLEVEVAVDPFEFGGQRYELRDGAVDARLDISHTVSGYAFRLRFDAALEGPCVRCLEIADQGWTWTRARSTSPAAARTSTRPTTTRGSSTCARGLATPWRSRCPRRSSAARTARACARCAART